MTTLKEELQKLTALKHRLAVWEAVHSHLDDTLIGKDGRGAMKVLKVSDCLTEVVSEDTVEDVLQTIGDGPITELKKQISDIEGQQW